MDNITQRDSKRPSERPRDKEYHRRFSRGFPIPIGRNDAVYGLDRSLPPVPLGRQSWPNENSFSPPGRTVVQVDFHNNNRPVQPPILAGHTQPGLLPGQGNRGNGAYYISLICSGDTVQVLVWPTKSIGELIEDWQCLWIGPSWNFFVAFYVATSVTSKRLDDFRSPLGCSRCVGNGL